MSKAKSMPETIMGAMSSTLSTPEVGERAQTFWHAQSAAVDRIQSYVDGWYDRRRKGAAAAAECCGLMFGDGADLSAAPRAWIDWVTGSMERLSQDVQEQVSLSTQLASDWAGAISANGGHPHKRRAHAHGKADKAD